MSSFTFIIYVYYPATAMYILHLLLGVVLLPTAFFSEIILLAAHALPIPPSFPSSHVIFLFMLVCLSFFFFAVLISINVFFLV